MYAFADGGGFGLQPRFWESITLAGNGALFDLTSNAVSMYNDLMSIIDEACLPRDEQDVMNFEDMGYMFASSYEYNSVIRRYDYKNKMCR